MLCDEVAADRASASGMDVGPVIDRIKGAQKFVLGAEFAAVADALSEDYTGLVRAFPACRLPYPQTWVEVAHADRPNFCAAQVHAPGVQASPRRIGYLLSAIRPDLAAWKAHLFWSFAGGMTSAAGLAMEFDMTVPDDVAVPAAVVDEQEGRRVRSVFGRDIPVHPGWTASSEAVKAALLRHTNPVQADYDMPPPVGLPPDKWFDFYAAMASLARLDWAGEATYLLAVIGLLNARNAVDVRASDLSRLNKARVKRGAPPLHEHKVLHIAQRQVKRVYPDGMAHADHAPMRGHFVRGHFKATKWGIFFWRPHARGHLSRGWIEKEYQL